VQNSNLALVTVVWTRSPTDLPIAIVVGPLLCLTTYLLLRWCKRIWAGSSFFPVLPWNGGNLSQKIGYTFWRVVLVVAIGSACFTAQFLILEAGRLSGVRLETLYGASSVALVIVAILLATVALFNRPRLLVPPQARSSKGLLG